MGALRFGPFTLDLAARRLDRDGAEIALQPKVFETLRYLVENPGRVIGREEFLSRLWADTYVGDAALTRCVKEVRRALGDDSRSPRFVGTVPGVGYRFLAEIQAESVAAPGDEVRSLAVLPFRPLSRDQRDPGLELGMADALITRLSGLRSLVVRPLGTVRRFAELDEDPMAAGRELGVDAVVEGSLHRLGDRIRVSVRVLLCEGGRALLAQQYDESFDDVFHVQDSVCRKIAAAVSLQLNQTEAARIVKHETDDLEAYRHFLRGRLGLGRLIPDEARRSIAHFEKALERDPRFAQALLSIAEANIIIAWQGVDAARYYEAARRAARRALDIDPQSGGAWSALATVAWEHDWKWRESDRMFRRALELAPNLVDVWGNYSGSCAFSGRSEEAVRLARRAVEIDVNSPMANAWLAQALYMAGRTQEAIAVGESIVSRSPHATFARFILGIAYLHSGRIAEAVDALEEAAATGRPDFLGVLAYAYVRAGKDSEASALEARLHEQCEAGEAPAIAIAMIHAARGEGDRFFEAMERAVEQRGLHAALIASEPLLEPFRADPRAGPLIRRLGLPVSR
jgi:DNA-binding winged helix-turn-helix (wHTH) protein/Tfp pilus assembly protein PilF